MTTGRSKVARFYDGRMPPSGGEGECVDAPMRDRPDCAFLRSITAIAAAAAAAGCAPVNHEMIIGAGCVRRDKM